MSLSSLLLATDYRVLLNSLILIVESSNIDESG